MTETGAAAVGARIRALRKASGMTGADLAEHSAVSRSYLSELENGTGNHRRPSAEVLYRIGSALGVSMSELLGKPLIIAPPAETPESLRVFAERRGLAESDIDMLRSIRFRGGAPKTAERWEFIYNAISHSGPLDST